MPATKALSSYAKEILGLSNCKGVKSLLSFNEGLRSKRRGGILNWVSAA